MLLSKDWDCESSLTPALPPQADCCLLWHTDQSEPLLPLLPGLHSSLRPGSCLSPIFSPSQLSCLSHHFSYSVKEVGRSWFRKAALHYRPKGNNLTGEDKTVQDLYQFRGLSVTGDNFLINFFFTFLYLFFGQMDVNFSLNLKTCAFWEG